MVGTGRVQDRASAQGGSTEQGCRNFLGVAAVGRGFVDVLLRIPQSLPGRDYGDGSIADLDLEIDLPLSPGP
ncbi:hypothetical protein D9M70_333620 [compost metagenome]